MTRSIAALTTAALAACTSPADAAPEELGAIAWRTDFAAAQAESRRTGKPMLVLFDEVPGCSTVRAFGRDVLSETRVVQAAEALFVPTLVYNNRPEHAALLASFEEPSWNNPVVRFITPDRKALTPRHAGDYTAAGLLRRMPQALEAARRPVPPWLALAIPPRRTEKATFAMYCFWSGEAAIGALDGVVRTEAGFLAGREVVDVEFDPSVLPFSKLHAAAKAAGQADQVYARTAAQAAAVPGSFRTDAPTRVSAKDTKYTLRRHPLSKLALTPAQQTRINAALARRMAPDEYLLPRQVAAWRQRD